ncbi:MAG: diguanylate cyclase, partial [Acidimicrobiales bacterium]
MSTSLNRDVDLSQAVEIAPRVWWVGSLLANDRFQCHVYLIEQGDQSVLIDPGSALTAPEVIRKIDQVIGVRNVRWLVCSHADPDIIGALPALETHGLHPAAQIVTHWRDETLIVHSGTQLPFWRIERHQWRLALEDRTLRFVFTPYLHFAGAFVSFDESTGTLFSSDLFGGFDAAHTLYAETASYFDAIRSFHEHYMPSREILAHAMGQLRSLPLERIAPQHGQVIPGPLIAPIMDQLETLECGIYLLSREEPGLAFLLGANRTIHDVVDTLVREQHFSAVATFLADLAVRNLGAQYLEIWSGEGDLILVFERVDGFTGHPGEPPGDVRRVIEGGTPPDGTRLILPLRSPVSEGVNGAAVIGFATPTVIDDATHAVIAQITGLVEVGLEREVLRRTAELERVAWHERALHDPLTGLYNRASLSDVLEQVFRVDDAGDSPRVAVLMVDVDHFKAINDTFSHATGDRVLQHVAAALTQSVRPTDVVFRYGGEEFLVVLVDVDLDVAASVAERVRQNVSVASAERPTVSVSVGLVVRHCGETSDLVMARADAAL